MSKLKSTIPFFSCLLLISNLQATIVSGNLGGLQSPTGPATNTNKTRQYAWTTNGGEVTVTYTLTTSGGNLSTAFSYDGIFRNPVGNNLGVGGSMTITLDSITANPGWTLNSSSTGDTVAVVIEGTKTARFKVNGGATFDYVGTGNAGASSQQNFTDSRFTEFDAPGDSLFFQNIDISTNGLNLRNLAMTFDVTAEPVTPPRPRYLPVGNYNVLFIAVDDLKPNFGPFSTPELAAAMPVPITPNLDSLTNTGMAFTRAYCQQAVCWASRTSLLTGLRPDTTKVWDDGIKFRTTMPGVITLPQHFANKGYSVSSHGKIFDYRSTAAGQDEAISWPDGHTDYNPPHNFYEDGHWQVESETGAGQNRFATDAGATNYWVTPNRPVNPNTDYVDGKIATGGINDLNAFATNYKNNGKRFFLGVGFIRPHLPFTSPKTFWDLYDPARIDLTGYTGAKDMPTGTLPFTASAYEVGSYGDIEDTGSVTDVADARRLIHGYLAATSHMDAQLGRVLKALKDSGVADNTIVVLWGDHGWQLGDHNGFWAKHSCYEQAAHAPLIIRAPGMDTLDTAGKVCTAPVEFVDIFPTLVDLASLAKPNQPAGLQTQGTSLRPLLEDPAQPWKKAAFTQYQRNITGDGITNPGNGMGYTMRTSRYRYTEWWRTQTTLVNGNSTDRDVKLYSTPEHVELYDMQTDPNETVNLANDPAYAGLKAELSAALAGGYGWDTAAVSAPAEYPITWAGWQAACVEPGSPLGSFGNLLDPDGDGVNNLFEYVTGSHPLVRDASLPWSSSVVDISGTKHLALEYPLVGARSDVTTSAKWSTDLTNWSATGVTNENLGSKANRSTLRSRIPIDGAASSAGFLRLESTR